MKKHEETKEQVSERFNKLLKLLDLNPTQFASGLGLDRVDTIYNISSGKSKPNYDILRLITKNYKDVDIEAFLKGEDELLKTGKNAPLNAPENALLSDEFKKLLTESDDKTVLNFILKEYNRVIAENTKKTEQIDKLLETNSKLSETIAQLSIQANDGQNQDVDNARPDELIARAGSA